MLNRQPKKRLGAGRGSRQALGQVGSAGQGSRSFSNLTVQCAALANFSVSTLMYPDVQMQASMVGRTSGRHGSNGGS